MVDPQVIKELKSLGGDGSVFSRVQSLFLTKVPEALADITQHAHNQDAAALADRVHGLRSMFMTIGAIKASRACEQLETAARIGAINQNSALIESVVHEAQAAMTAVKRYA